MNYVLQTNSSENIASLAAKNFPCIFPNPSDSCRLQSTHSWKALTWWKTRENFISKLTSPVDSMLYVSTTSALCIGRKRFYVKAMSGRGRKREVWVQFVYEYVEKEFERICELGVKVNSCILMEIAVRSFNDAECPVGPGDVYSEPGKLCKDLITYDFVYRFRLRSNIVNRRECGKNERSPEFTEWTERNIAYHLGN